MLVFQPKSNNSRVWCVGFLNGDIQIAQNHNFLLDYIEPGAIRALTALRMKEFTIKAP